MPCWSSSCQYRAAVGHCVHDADFVNRAGYVVSAIFICIEYQRLGIKYRQHRILRMSFWVKLAFIIIEVALAIGTLCLHPLETITC